MLSTFQTALGSQVYTNTDTVVNDSLGIAFLGFIGYLASTVAVKQFVAEPGPVAGSIKYIVLLAFGCNGSGILEYKQETCLMCIHVQKISIAK